MIGKELGLSATELGLIFSAFAYPDAFMQIYGGWLADRFGPRLVLTILSAVWALATVMTGISSGVAALVLWRVLVGVGEGSAFPAATALSCCFCSTAAKNIPLYESFAVDGSRLIAFA